jgi:hypothetical protein
MHACGRVSDRRLVLLGRIELPTSSLPMTRSTTELQQQLVPAGTVLRMAGAAYGCTTLPCQGKACRAWRQGFIK